MQSFSSLVVSAYLKLNGFTLIDTIFNGSQCVGGRGFFPNFSPIYTSLHTCPHF